MVDQSFPSCNSMSSNAISMIFEFVIVWGRIVRNFGSIFERLFWEEDEIDSCDFGRKQLKFGKKFCDCGLFVSAKLIFG